jgi:serine/threonine protein phosphatase PrpC
MLTEPEIGEILAAYEDDVHEAAERLVQQANASGGLDNISVIVVRVMRDQASARP